MSEGKASTSRVQALNQQKVTQLNDMNKKLLLRRLTQHRRLRLQLLLVALQLLVHVVQAA